MAVDGEIEGCYRSQYRRLVGVVAVVAGSIGLAEESVQEAFARAIATSRRGRAFDHLPAWVVTVALNHARNGRRRASSERKALQRLVAAPTMEGLGDPSSELALRAAISELARRQQDAVVLYYLLDMDVASVASTLGVSSGTVKTALSRARDRLAVLLSDAELEA